VRPNLTYPITNPKTGEQHLPPRGRCWRISPEKCASALADGRLLFGKNGNGRPQLKVFLNEQEEYGSIASSWFDAEKFETATHGSKELQLIFGGEKVFTSPKPIALVRELLKLTTISDKNLFILDFFAGSGTTLHATMQLNSEDGGHRQCILVTNNENKICEEVTYVRNQRVIQGYTTPKGEVVEGLHANNLRYYKTAFVPRAKTIANMRTLTAAATELLCIKNNVYKEIGAFGGQKLPAKVARYFDDGKTRMLVIYAEAAIVNFVDLLLEMEVDGKILVYVFSNSNYAYDDDFEEVLDKVELCALPDAIYKAYKKVLPSEQLAQETGETAGNEAANATEEDAQ